MKGEGHRMARSCSAKCSRAAHQRFNIVIYDQGQRYRQDKLVKESRRRYGGRTVDENGGKVSIIP